MHSPDELKSFYEDWASIELEDPQRKAILEWKTDEMAQIIHDSDLKIDSIMELGCAEGIILNRLGAKLKAKRLYGVDLSQKFVSIGQQRYPHINFLNQSWEETFLQDQKVDLLVVSDFIEHLPDPDLFLEKIKPQAHHFMFKIPLEKAWLLSIYKTVGRWPKIGPNHPSGHLHEYDQFQALTLVRSHGYGVLHAKSLVPPFKLVYGKVRKWYVHPSVVLHKLVVTLFPKKWQIRLIGGSLFALCALPED
jgi:hypothetical protein